MICALYVSVSVSVFVSVSVLFLVFWGIVSWIGVWESEWNLVGYREIAVDYRRLCCLLLV